LLLLLLFPHPPKILMLRSYKYFLIHICIESLLSAGLSSSYVPVNIYSGNQGTYWMANSLCIIAIFCFTCFSSFPIGKIAVISSSVLSSHRHYQLVLLYQQMLLGNNLPCQWEIHNQAIFTSICIHIPCFSGCLRNRHKHMIIQPIYPRDPLHMKYK